MWLRFVSEYCKGIKYVFKIDDDVVIDIYKVMSTIYERKKNSSHSDDLRTISGSCYKESYVVRNKTSKWYTLEERKNKVEKIKKVLKKKEKQIRKKFIQLLPFFCLYSFVLQKQQKIKKSLNFVVTATLIFQC